MEQYNKEHLKETLKIKSKAHANELDIRGIQREVEKYSLKLNASRIVLIVGDICRRKLGGTCLIDIS